MQRWSDDLTARKREQSEGWRHGLFVQLLRYGLVGLVNTAFGLGTILGLQELAGIEPIAANACGYAVGLSVSFALNRAWTFGARDATGARLLRFLVAFAIAYAANLATLALLIRPLGAVAAQTVALAVYSVAFFLLCRRKVFAPEHR